MEDITRNGKSGFTGAEAFNEFINLLFLKFKEHDIRKELKKNKQNKTEDNDESDERDERDENDEIRDKFLKSAEVDEDFLIENLYERYCKVYDKNKGKTYDKDSKNIINEQANELYNVLYDFNRQWDETQQKKNGKITGAFIKKLNGKKKCVMGNFYTTMNFITSQKGKEKPKIYHNLREDTNLILST